MRSKSRSPQVRQFTVGNSLRRPFDMSVREDKDRAGPSLKERLEFGEALAFPVTAGLAIVAATLTLLLAWI